MATNVANQLPYTPIEPLPVPIERYPTLRLEATRFVLVIIAAGYAIAAGATLGLGTMLFTPLTGAFAGGLVGLVVGVFLSRMVYIPTLLANYRIETLEQMKQIITDERTLGSIEFLKKFFQKPFKAFAQTYENHRIHSKITHVTDQVDKGRLDIVKVWKTFLNHLDKKVVLNPDGNRVKLDFSRELKRLEKKEEPKINLGGLDPRNPDHDKDFAAVEQIQRVSFGVPYTFPKERIKEKMLKDPNSCCLVARDGQEVVGFAWTGSSENGGITILGIARDPGAARLSIGDNLLRLLLMHLPKDKSIFLHVRKSNPALRLYKEWGFEIVKTLPNYYKFAPPEPGHLMKLNWKKCEEMQKKITTRQ